MFKDLFNAIIRMTEDELKDTSKIILPRQKSEMEQMLADMKKNKEEYLKERY